MKLEQEIKQKKFKDEYQKASVNIPFTYFWVQDKLRDRLKPHDISLQQFNILRILRGQYPNPATINILKERMLDKSSDASRLVERLRIKGYIERMVSTKDRRSVDIRISETGLSMLATIDEDFWKYEAVFEVLTNDEVRVLNELLDKLRSPADVG